ncbi:MAG: ribosomal-processing cysteine protease Prp [Candidatus Muiribacteriota bacterium]|jgi:uncharacterized protein YsxB (DUF464 family)
MINIRLATEGDLIKKINIRGHAEFDVPGKDIVCAGVSALYFACLNSLKIISADSDKIFSVKSVKGDAEIEFLSAEKASQIIATVLVVGLKNIEKEYGNFVKIEEVNLNGT